MAIFSSMSSSVSCKSSSSDTDDGDGRLPILPIDDDDDDGELEEEDADDDAAITAAAASSSARTFCRKRYVRSTRSAVPTRPAAEMHSSLVWGISSRSPFIISSL